MREQTILFDLDDTLVHCNKYFDFVIDQFVDLMLTWYSGHGLNAAGYQAEAAPNRSCWHSYSWLYAGSFSQIVC